MKQIIHKISATVLSVILVSLLFSPFAPARAAGASLFFAPSTGTYGIGSNFSIQIKVNTGGETINAVEANITFDLDKIEVVSISRTGSIFSIWPVGPNFSNKQGTISFGGGMPSPGYNGNQGLVSEIVFRPKKVGDAQLIFTSGSVLANDGKGTNVLTSIGSASYTIAPQTDAPIGSTPKTSDLDIDLSEKEEVNKPSVVLDVSQFVDENFWHNSNNLVIKWDTPTSTTEVSFAFDQNPSSEPGKKGLAATSEELNDVDDGIWYFHVRYKENNEWTDTKTYKVKVDTTPPSPVEVSVQDGKPGDWPILNFASSDETSGLSKYQIHIDSFSEKEMEVGPMEKSVVASGLAVGKHVAMVKAIDNAGNQSYGTTEFIVKPIEMPVVKNYSQELKTNDRFFISGTSVPNATINVYIQKSEEDKLISKKTQADSFGNWYFVDDSSRSNGRYVAWVEAVNENGLRSSQSDRVSFLVTPPVFARIGDFVVNYFTVFASLLFMIVLIVAALLYIGEILRKRIKKETYEVEEVLRDNLHALKKEIDRDMARLAKVHGAEELIEERYKAKSKIHKKIRIAEKKIMKEVKDVEDILK